MVIQCHPIYEDIHKLKSVNKMKTNVYENYSLREAKVILMGRWF